MTTSPAACAVVVAALVVQAAATVASARPLDGGKLIARFECARCHDGLKTAASSRDKHCVHCHREIIAGTFRAPAEAMARWQSHLVSLRQVPSLDGAGQRLRRDWVKRFLLQPHDVRPALRATMPRLAMTPEEAEAIAAHLVAAEAPDPAPSPSTPARVAAGRVLFERLPCATCHRFTGAQVAAAAAPPAATTGANAPGDAPALAPDLRFTRQRLQRARVVEMIRDPQSLHPGSLMPRLPLSEAEAGALAAFVLDAPLSPAPSVTVPARLPVLARRVGYGEVNDKVFRRTCWHCHSTPDYNLGDGGPGNTGGFGFRGRGLDMSTSTSLASGARDDKGARRSVFLPMADGTPRLLAFLLARQVEEAGGAVEAVRGMPLGLPALTPEQLQLVETWIAQGRPR